MATKIRPELSENNKYWISKHRYYELKHFCLQYPIWKLAYSTLDDMSISQINLGMISSSNTTGDPTARCTMMKLHYSERINMVEKAALEADKDLYPYILKAVTQDLSYNHLKTKLDIPCGKDMYYDRYRKFFWILSKARQ